MVVEKFVESLVVEGVLAHRDFFHENVVQVNSEPGGEGGGGRLGWGVGMHDVE